ncbi:MAG: type II toxin-antitoxin system Phd/YefM family antitoxin [Parcubacteria group bacterium]|nr:type II toxin-antitoxin system Phd/YefM family antitoxin [Parcubacteria group bacterium]
MYKVFPKTVSIQEIQKSYRTLFNEVMKTKDPLLVLKKNKPEVVILDVETYEHMVDNVEKFEHEMARQAIEDYHEAKKAGTLIKINSLADLL